jgi:NADH:ubiquinone oxidoreductase subunit 6 (subunit J)
MSKVSSFVAALCILIYIAAVGFGVVRLVIDIGQRRNLANREFQELANRASSAAVFLGFMSQAYQQNIRDSLDTSQTLLGVIISSSSGDFAFERFPGRSVAWAGNSPRFINRIDFPSQPLFLPLRIEGQTHVNIQAIYSNINTDFLLVVLRETLFAVLIALAIAFIVLLVELTQKNRHCYQTAAPADSAPVVDSPPPPDPVVYRALPEEKAAPAGPVPVVSEAGGSPHGLFTPRGNIGWESYTHDRLESELRRCASFEQDLALLVMEFKCVQKIDDALARQIAEQAVAFFGMRDLIFERGEKGITVIIPSIDLEQGMSKSEEFRIRIASNLPESFIGRHSLYIGLSSRSGRLIEAQRLIIEASTALEKTLEEPVSHVVAFKSDPEKYRQFLKRRS